jgi:hypothetical protein
MRVYVDSTMYGWHNTHTSYADILSIGKYDSNNSVSGNLISIIDEPHNDNICEIRRYINDIYSYYCYHTFIDNMSGLWYVLNLYMCSRFAINVTKYMFKCRDDTIEMSISARPHQ